MKNKLYPSGSSSFSSSSSVFSRFRARTGDRECLLMPFLSLGAASRCAAGPHRQLTGLKFHFRSSLVIFGNLRSSRTPSAPVIGKLTNVLNSLVFFSRQASTPLQTSSKPHGAHRSTGSFPETESVFMSSCVRMPARTEILASAFLRAKRLPYYPAPDSL